MLLLPFQLLAVLFPGGDSERAFQGPTSFHVIQTSSFTNSTWAQTQGSGWLDDLQIHGWDSDSGTAILLKPWSKGNFSDKEFAELEEIFRVYIFGFAQEVQDFAGDFQIQYPFEIQGIAGCELHSGGAIVSFLRGALRGLDFLSVKNASCVPSPEGGSKAQKVCALIMQYQGIMETVRILLYETCPRYLLGVLNAGKADLQRQVLKEPVSFHVIQMASFYNHSWKRNLVSSYLGDLQTYTLDRNCSTIIFLWPWSRGNFSNEEWKELEMLFHIRCIQFLEGMRRYSRELQFECEFSFLHGEWRETGDVSMFLIPVGNSLTLFCILFYSFHHKTAIGYFWARALIKTLILQTLLLLMNSSVIDCRVMHYYLFLQVSYGHPFSCLTTRYFQLSHFLIHSLQQSLYIYLIVTHCIPFNLSCCNPSSLTPSPSSPTVFTSLSLTNLPSSIRY
uniref:CD1b molecule n=1 Tax=Macaca fascicularis TaxID=9541 RepID=A0A7N9CY27_MACFA